MTRDVLPVEQIEDGLYINPSTATTKISVGGEDTYLVAAEDFMAVQKERDEYRRTLALINAWRIDRNRDEQRLTQLLEKAGFTFADAQAMVSLIASVRAGT
jgi:hypothetical protein